MDIELCCQKCDKVVNVNKMIFKKDKILLIPECGHMHVCWVIRRVDDEAHIETEYYNADFLRIEGTNKWKKVGHHNAVTCEKCNIEVQGYRYCPKCNMLFPKEILDIVYPKGNDGTIYGTKKIET